MIVLTSQLKIAYFARFRNEGTMFMPYSKIDVELSPSNVGTFLPLSFEREKLSIFLSVCVSITENICVKSEISAVDADR